MVADSDSLLALASSCSSSLALQIWEFQAA
jgi:hypothetical protein